MSAVAFIACGCLQCDSILGGECACTCTGCDEFAGNELCMPRTSTTVFSVYLIYLRPFSPAQNAVTYIHVYMYFVDIC